MIMPLTIHTGKRQEPDRILLYGTEGIGKSTWAAAAPAPVFLDLEGGINHLDVASIDLRHAGLPDVLDALGSLSTEDHAFRTIVLDTADALEPRIWRDVCDRGGKINIEAFGYGKGYTLALAQWREIVTMLDRIRDARGLDIVLLAHAQIRTFSNPSGENYDRFEPTVHKAAAALLKQWADTVLFACHEENVRKDGPKAKAIASGRRILHTTHAAAWDAKNRCSLPATLPLDYEDYAKARSAARPAAPEALYDEACSMLAHLAPEDGPKIAAFLAAHRTDASILALAVNRLRGRMIETPSESDDSTTPEE
jgi:hypothetical protein